MKIKTTGHAHSVEAILVEVTVVDRELLLATEQILIGCYSTEVNATQCTLLSTARQPHSQDKCHEIKTDRNLREHQANVNECQNECRFRSTAGAGAKHNIHACRNETRTQSEMYSSRCDDA